MIKSKKSKSVRRRSKKNARTTRPYRKNTSSKRRRYRRRNTIHKKSINGSNGSKRRSKGRKRRSNRSNRKKRTYKKRRIVGGAPIENLVKHVGEVYVKDDHITNIIPTIQDMLAKSDAEMRTAGEAFVAELKTSVGSVSSDLSVPSSAPKARVFARAQEFFGGCKDEFDAAIDAYLRKVLGEPDVNEMKTWLQAYNSGTHLFKKTGDEVTDYIDAVVLETGLSGDLASYIDNRDVLVVKTVNGTGETEMDFAELKKWAILAKKPAIFEFFDKITDTIPPHIVTKLQGYYPDDSVKHDIKNDGEIRAALLAQLDGLGKVTTATAVAGLDDAAKADRRLDQIIGSLYLKNDASPEQIHEAFHHKDMGDPSEVEAWLALGEETWGPPVDADDKTACVRSRPDVPVTGVDETSVFSHDGVCSAEEFLTELRKNDSAGFVALMAAANGVKLGLEVDTDAVKRAGLMNYMKRVISKRVLTATGGSCGALAVLNRLVNMLNTDYNTPPPDPAAPAETTFGKKQENAKRLLDEADTCWAAYGAPGNAVDHVGEKFDTSQDISSKSLVFFPYIIDQLTVKHMSNLSAFYNGRPIDLAKLKPDITDGTNELITAMNRLIKGKIEVENKDTDEAEFIVAS